MKSQALHFLSWTFPSVTLAVVVFVVFSLSRTFSSIVVRRIRDESSLSCFLEVFLKFP